MVKSGSRFSASDPVGPSVCRVQLVDGAASPYLGRATPLATAPLGEVGVAVDGDDRCTLRPRTASKPTTTPDLPHARRPLANRLGAALRPLRRGCRIPTTQGHPYSYRDSYRDGAGPDGSGQARYSRSGVARSEGFEPPTF